MRKSSGYSNFRITVNSGGFDPAANARGYGYYMVRAKSEQMAKKTLSGMYNFDEKQFERVENLGTDQWSNNLVINCGTSNKSTWYQ